MFSLCCMGPVPPGYTMHIPYGIYAYPIRKKLWEASIRNIPGIAGNMQHVNVEGVSGIVMQQTISSAIVMQHLQSCRRDVHLALLFCNRSVTIRNTIQSIPALLVRLTTMSQWICKLTACLRISTWVDMLKDLFHDNLCSVGVHARLIESRLRGDF